MFICHQENAGQKHNIKTGNRCFESVAMFKHFESMRTFRYLRTTLTNQKCLPRNAYYCCQESCVFQIVIQKYKNEIYRSMIFPVVLNGLETWSATLVTVGEEHIMRLLENMLPWKNIGPNM